MRQMREREGEKKERGRGEDVREISERAEEGGEERREKRRDWVQG